MKNFLLILFCFAGIAKSYGQTVKKNTYAKIVVEVTKKKRRLPAIVEVKPIIIEGDSSLVQSFTSNLDKSIQVGKRIKKGKYIVSVKFIVAKDGSLSDISCENDPGFGMCQEVIRVLMKSKKWQPAEVRVCPR